jgi:cobalt-zinc-cadmium efflux system outer membrane protein
VELAGRGEKHPPGNHPAEPLKASITISFAIALAPIVCSGGDTISLDGLVAEALAGNPEIKAFSAEIVATKGERRTAGEWQNPEASTEAGTKIVRDYHGNTLGDGIMWTLGATQTFEYPGRVTLRKAIANHQVALAELGLEGFRTALAARVRAAAFRAALGKAKAGAADEIAKRFDELATVLSQRPVAGVAQQADVQIIEASAITLKRRPLEAQREMQSAIYELNQLRGARVDSPLALPNIDLTLRPLPSVATLLATARERNYDVRTRVLELEQQGYKVRLALNERWPAVRIGPVAHNERADTNEYLFGITATLPLPLWNMNTGKIETEKARAAKAEAELMALIRDVERKVADAEFVYRSRREEADDLQKSVLPQMREAAETGDRNYREGAIPVSTYTELQKQYLDSVDAFTAAQAAAVEARQQLEQLTAMRLNSEKR